MIIFEYLFATFEEYFELCRAVDTLTGTLFETNKSSKLRVNTKLIHTVTYL